MSHLVSPDGHVVSVDIDQDLVDQARLNLATAGHPEVTVIRADGAGGLADRAPYDRIIATVGVWDLAPAWLDQLAPGGRIVVPLDLGGLQRSVAFEAVDDHWESRSVVPCGFMRLRGAFAGPERTHVLDSGLTLVLPDGGDVDAAALLAALAAPPTRRVAPVTATARELFAGVGLWLAINGQPWCGLSGSMPAPGFSPLEVIADHGHTGGLITGDSLGLLGPVGESGEVVTIGYGPDGERLADDLADHLGTWAGAGKPGGGNVEIAAHPLSTPDSTLGGRHILHKSHTKLALSFPD
jgi:protein-L-isoaspartate(D-aspartate) O-methyltransferase